MEKNVTKTKSKIILPNFQIKTLSKIPQIRIKSVYFNKFKVFDDLEFSFVDNGKVIPFICFVGSNGSGKSTILHALQLIFQDFAGWSSDRVQNNLSGAVRHTRGYRNEILSKDDFSLIVEIQSSDGDYVVELNRKGFIKDHPQNIKDVVSRICYSTRFDQELHNFQINSDDWPIFKKLFESVTGFTIEEYREPGAFTMEGSARKQELMDKYVLSFLVHKPHETILHKECSDGERKIIKAFSTLLNLEYTPQIILADNVEMHVESARHLPMVKCMQECYPKSQIFTTAHSYHISRHFQDRSQIYDLRLIHSSDVVQEEPWRLYLLDELQDCLIKVAGLTISKEYEKKIVFTDKKREVWMMEGLELLKICSEQRIGRRSLRNLVQPYLSKVNEAFVDSLIWSCSTRDHGNSKPKISVGGDKNVD